MATTIPIDERIADAVRLLDELADTYADQDAPDPTIMRAAASLMLARAKELRLA